MSLGGAGERERGLGGGTGGDRRRSDENDRDRRRYSQIHNHSPFSIYFPKKKFICPLNAIICLI